MIRIWYQKRCRYLEIAKNFHDCGRSSKRLLVIQLYLASWLVFKKQIQLHFSNWCISIRIWLYIIFRICHSSQPVSNVYALKRVVQKNLLSVFQDAFAFLQNSEVLYNSKNFSLLNYFSTGLNCGQLRRNVQILHLRLRNKFSSKYKLFLRIPVTKHVLFVFLPLSL